MLKSPGVVKMNEKEQKIADALREEICKLFKCDDIRVTQPLNVYFLVLQWNRRSEGNWQRITNKNGKTITEAVNFNYVEEKVIAAGTNIKNLMANAKESVSLSSFDKDGLKNGER